MIHRTEHLFRRRGKSAPGNYHNEKVMRRTWWFLWVIPVYVVDEIIASNL